MKWYDNVKVSESPEQIRFKEKEAEERVALGLEIITCQIQGNGVTICPALKETHWGNSSIYNPKKVFVRKSQITGKTSSRMTSSRVWEVSFSDLGQPVNF